MPDTVTLLPGWRPRRYRMASHTTPKRVRDEEEEELDLPPCGTAWGTHRCYRWTGWPHTCRCTHCGTQRGLP